MKYGRDTTMVEAKEFASTAADQITEILNAYYRATGLLVTSMKVDMYGNMSVGLSDGEPCRTVLFNFKIPE